MATALNDVASAALVAAAVSPGTKTSTVTGSAIDMITADGPCFAVQQVGAFSATSLAGVIQESADGSTGWAAVSGAAFASVTGANNVQIVTFARTARYLRYVGTITGGSPSIDMAVLVGEQKKTV
jgi:hypothetical protein